MPLILVTPYRLKKIVEAITSTFYSTFDSVSKGSDVVLSNGNLTVKTSSIQTFGARSTLGVTTGKHYMEFEVKVQNAVQIGVGIDGVHASNTGSDSPKAVTYFSDGRVNAQGTVYTYGYEIKAGDVLGVALDRDTKQVFFYLNGRHSASAAFPSTLTATEKVYAFVKDSVYFASSEVTANFGATPFKYPIPREGFKAGLYLDFATWNRARLAPEATLDADGLTLTTSLSGYRGGIATIGKSTGTWYWEVEVLSGYPMVGIGLSSAHDVDYPYQQGSGIFYYPNGTIYKNGAVTAGFVKFGVGDVIGVVLHADSDAVSFYVNGVLSVSHITNERFGTNPIFPIVCDASNTSGANVRTNFGATPFKYSVPAGSNAGLF